MYKKLVNMVDWAKNDLNNNLLKWWMEHTIDEKNGGFLGRVQADNSPEDANKFIVQNARILWTFSACYELEKNVKYKEYADRAYSYFTKFFHDDRHGGFYTRLSSKGELADDSKFMYGNAYAIYALSEYARVFKTLEPDTAKTAKQLAQETFKLMDCNMWDAEYKGYFEMASRDWKYTPGVLLINYDTKTQKTMNTHLHILEAYTNLLRIDGNSKALRSRVRELLYIFLNKIIDRDNWHLYLFQERDWTATTPVFTIGHDIEASWLLYETAEILREPEALADTKKVCINMARAVYDDGIADCGALYTEFDPRARHFSDDFSWWEQNEAVVGFLNAYQLTKEEKFLDAAVGAWQYIDKHFIDREMGGWHAYVTQDGQPMDGAYKCSEFICPYHNARMSIEIIKRLSQKGGIE